LATTFLIPIEMARRQKKYDTSIPVVELAMFSLLIYGLYLADSELIGDVIAWGLVVCFSSYLYYLFVK